MIDASEFCKILSAYKKIKDEYATRRLKFYNDRVDGKRRNAQAVRWTILILSLSIPIVASLDLTILGLPNKLILSLMSMLIALASGLEGIHQWQLTWKDYSGRIVEIETLIGLWEVQVAKAKQLHDVNDISNLLASSTEKLLTEVNKTVSAEMESFFTAVPPLQTSQE
jgi:hypothetical protein